MLNNPAHLRLAAYQPDLAPNLGAMVRLAACAGVPLDVIEPCGFAFSLKALRQQALDYTDTATIIRHDSWDHFAAPARIILLSTGGATQLWDFAFRPADTLLVGRESAGVPDDVKQACDHIVSIPMPGGGRSLNVAMAAAIALYEAIRQMRDL